jgi:molecular chaperone DnaJ
MEDIFSSFGDIFGDFFGGGRSRRRKGEDIVMNLELTFQEALFGAQKAFPSAALWNARHATARAPRIGTARTVCETCKGQGQVALAPGDFSCLPNLPCLPGPGTVIKHKCPECKGKGKVSKTESLKVTIPAGINHNQTIRLSGKGQPAPERGVPGDLYVNGGRCAAPGLRA